MSAVYAISVWRTIRNLQHAFSLQNKLKVGNGEKLFFGENNRLGIDSLKFLFPEVYILNQQQGANTRKVQNNHGWNFSYRGALNYWEFGRFAEFYNTLAQLTGIFLLRDRLWWKGHNSGEYSIKTAYHLLKFGNNINDFWPWKHIWKTDSI